MSDFEPLAYAAWSSTDPAAWQTAIADARTQNFDAGVLTARLAVLDAVSVRDIISRVYSQFWRAVIGP